MIEFEFSSFLKLHLPGFILTFILVLVCIILHFQALVFLSRHIDPLTPLKRSRMILVVLGLFGTHLIEIWVFAFGFLALNNLKLGWIDGHMASQNIIELLYFSSVTYTTIGYGDVTPKGASQFMAGMEALTGLILIAWSASFAYIEMNKFWSRSS